MKPYTDTEIGWIFIIITVLGIVAIWNLAGWGWALLFLAFMFTLILIGMGIGNAKAEARKEMKEIDDKLEKLFKK